MNLALRCGRGHSWAKVTRGPSSQRPVELCTSNSTHERWAQGTGCGGTWPGTGRQPNPAAEPAVQWGCLLAYHETA